MTKVEDRFLKYVSFDTTSLIKSQSVPSTEGQKVLAAYIVEEMKSIGIEDATMDENGYVYGSIPSNMDSKGPVLGFIAHMDTSEAVSGKDIKARIIHGYEGGDIVLNEEKQIVMKADEYETLAAYIGQDLIVTDGTTLLGADDKAGIAEILTAAEYLLAHPEIPHPEVKVAFTPDEEIGRGAKLFDMEHFGADYGYTIDGSELGELEYENFNAAGVHLKIHGTSIHPGSAKGKMVNSVLVAMELNQMLPAFENPAFTEGYEGFFHLDEMLGNVELTTMHYLIRDHDRALFEKKKEIFQKAVDFLNDKYGEGTIDAEIKDSYYNMKEQILPHFFLIENALKAMENLHITPNIKAIRGGTDGSVLSYKGLPCPNLCAGGCNMHSRYEYVSIQTMEAITQLILEIIHITGEMKTK